MIEHTTEIKTNAGAMGTFICHPERGGPRPVILFYMDAPGIREELRDMARRLACVGYYVMLPNLYYREGAEELGSLADPSVREKAFALMDTLTITKVQEDTASLLAFADKDKAASKGPIGCVGYCMSGQHAISAAVHYPGRITVAASFYGTRLVTEQPDSPHLTAASATAQFYIACAENDHYAPMEMVDTLRAALREAGTNAEIEIYPGTEHGFAFPSRAAYNKDAGERHWERLFALFSQLTS